MLNDGQGAAVWRLTPDRRSVERVPVDIASLDGLMVVMYFAIIHDIHDDLVKDFHPQTPQELFDFIEANKKRDPESIEAALEMIK